MTEKRSDYRKRQSRRKTSKLLSQVKSAFDDDQHNDDGVDVNPEFQRSESERRRLDDNDLEYSPRSDVNSDLPKEDKRLRLKKRLNRAILIVFVLIILVLLALFHL